jgi:hypothetical protein
MTFREDDMYPYVRKNLRVRYPAYKGWKIYGKDRWDGYESDFTVERKIHGKIQRVIVEVKVTCRVSQTDVDQLNSYVRNFSGGNAKIVEKILVVPSGADTSIVPYDMNVMFLKNFKCENDEIVWYK